MISLFSGTPGSGKSLHTASKIYYALLRKRPVICNFPINKDSVKNPSLFTYIENSDLTVDFLVNFSREYFRSRGGRIIEGQILLVVDECQLLFDCRAWNASGRSNWVKFFTQHRKFGYNIILVAQFDKMIDKQIRALVEYEFIHRKVSNFGWKGKILSIWTFNRLFVAVQMWYPMQTKVASEFYLYSKKLGNLYDTFDLFDNQKDVKRQLVEPKLEYEQK